MAERAVINASPLIFLSRSRHLDLLQVVAKEIWVPEPVAGEIHHRGAQDITARAIDETAWLISKPVPAVPTAIVEWRLGAGESGTLALATAHPGTEAIIDDQAGRKCAASLDIPVRGTLGILLDRQKTRHYPQGPANHRGDDGRWALSVPKGGGGGSAACWRIEP